MKFVSTKIKRYAKNTVYFLSFYSGIFYLFVAFYLKFKRRNYPAVILFYHRFKEQNETTVLARLWAKSFERQMLFLKKWCNVISLEALIEKIRNKEDFSRPTVVITIDDGFRDNYDVAYPILKHLDLPATIYLTSGFINTQKAPWVDEIGNALVETNLKKLTFPVLFGDAVIQISTSEQQSIALHSIYKELLYLEHDRNVVLVQQLLNVLGRNYGSPINERVMLNWEEIREMSQAGISFGAHTVTHPTLSRMRLEEAESEIGESKRTLEKELGIEINHFAIPNGQNKDFTEPLRAYCEAGLFASVTTTNHGCVTKSSDPFNLPRICIHAPFYYFSIELLRLLIMVRGEEYEEIR